MGERGPKGDPHSRRSMDRKGKLHVVAPFASKDNAVSKPQIYRSRFSCPKILKGQARIFSFDANLRI